MKVKGCDLKLADTVSLGFDKFDTATVVRIEGTVITLVRPYLVTDDYSHTGGVSWYIGVETFTVDADSNREYNVLSRKDLR